MKKALMILGLLIVFAASASAQVPAKPFAVYLGGGVSLPQSPDMFKDGYKMGFHGSGGVGFNVAPMFQIVAKAEYHTFSMDFDELGAGDEDLSGGTLSSILFGADGRFAFGVPASPVKPFLFAGGGFASNSISDLEQGGSVIFVAPDAETDFYLNVGGGIDMNNFFIQVRYLSIATEGESTVAIPITLGFKF